MKHVDSKIRARLRAAWHRRYLPVSWVSREILRILLNNVKLSELFDGEWNPDYFKGVVK